MNRAILTAGITAAVGLHMLLAAGPAAAASGKVTLYRNADFTAPAVARIYNSCTGTATLTNPVASFDNQPLPGCAVILQTRAGATFTLCAGRGIVPPAYREADRALIKPGTTPPCAITTSA
ncbi:hypothetical protein [Acrocarpospora pleiomorpha]|uniref:hypothetical protein n=1 Tax=Acrocarpospora pleiomorpha TaxID=90975 RepID=UPI0012D2BC4F|nr:hypothetical protein [Acrocarpospora pleiomorpha]